MYNLNRSIKWVFTFFICFSISTFSQSPDTTELRAGLWSLQFGVSSNFTLATFQGSTIAAKYQLSDKNAIRGGITFYGDKNDGTTSVSGSIADSSMGVAPGNTSSSYTNASVVVQYLWYINPEYPVHFYFGLGPSISYYKSSNSTYYADIYTVNTTGYWVYTNYSSESEQKGIGAAGCIGAEWFACYWLSLHAHYNETVQYQWNSDSNTRDRDYSNYPDYISTAYTEKTTGKGWYFSNPNVSFGLDIYF